MTAHIVAQAVVHPEAVVGERTRVWQFAVVLAGARIGADCNINAHTLVEGGAVLGDRVTLKCGVYVWNDRRPRSRQTPDAWAQTIVERGASIGAGAILLPGVRIGAGALIGAGAVVTKDVPAGETWVGNPAHKLRDS
jgi:UDP-2-acetamido-3-amino-2,3-dideoxy-glucuronate N-acetyltransferase